MVNLPQGPELLVILVVALVVLGPEQLPKAMRTVGKVMTEVRKISSGFQDEVRSAMGSLDGTDAKPRSATMESAAREQPSDGSGEPHAAEGGEGSVTEIVARNPAAPSAATDDEEAGGSPARPAIDPADRAAG